MMSTNAPGSLEAECMGGLDWAWYGLGECIRSTRDKVSVAFGVLSIAAWFMFGFPQMITNCIKKIPDEAVSKYLLIFWLLGDSLNFIGAFLTNQLFLQKVLAGYTVVIDIILILQYIYYYLRHKHKSKKYGDTYMKENASDISSTGRKSLSTVVLGVISLTMFYGPGLIPANTDYGSFPDRERRLFQTVTTPDPFADFLATKEEKIGYAIGWIGAVMYFCSRVPQIVTNFKRKTTEGLSIYLFLLAIFGNTFYGLQIFTKSIDAVFVVNSLPWILGSLGILIFDFIIMVQFFLYRKNTTSAEEFVFEEGDAESEIKDDYVF